MELYKTIEQLEEELASLRLQLEEANDTVEAIRTGQVDALVIKEDNGHQLYTLKSADQTYRVFIEKMNEGAVTLNEAGVILYSNTRFASMVNVPLSNVIGIEFSDFVSEQQLPLFNDLIKRGWKGDSKGEMLLLRPDGSLTPVLLSLTTLELDEGTALSVILTDLSIQKETELRLQSKNEELNEAYRKMGRLNYELEDKVRERTKELSMSREHFRFLADNIPVIVWTALPNGELDYYNKRWYEYTGLTLEESKGWGWGKTIHQDDLDKTIGAWKHSIDTGDTYRSQFRFRRAVDGLYRWHFGSAVPFKNSENNIIAWFGVCTDIDDQVKAMEKKDEFISMASHELKTPVTIIKAFTQILQLNFQEANNSSATEMLSKIDKQIDKLSVLITDLLDATKANIGHLRFDREKFEFNGLVKEIVDEMQRSTLTHRIQMELRDTVTVTGDRNRIGQVITNLLSNAIKYSGMADKVIIKSEIENNSLKLCVRDFGIGIPEAQQSKLFTRFFRADDTKANTYPGLGLGLYISKEIIERHGGQIKFSSTENKGSTFCFTLPLAD
jgi:two-component system, OmpR family, phosphate regulon sensor histidine kinase PhoR